MATTITSTRKRVSSPVTLGSGGNGLKGNGWGGGDSGDGGILDRYRLGMWIALAPILMMFVALTSAYIVREGAGGDWRSTGMPRILWFNTLLLAASSLSMEWARKSLKRGSGIAFNRWLSLTMLLGTAFIAGQFLAWRQLAARGVYLSTNPHSSFFYLLTGAHGLHLLGGVIALGYVVIGAWRDFGFPLAPDRLPMRRGVSTSDRRLTMVDVTAIYWHFMDGLWLYLFVLLLVWR